MSTTIGRNHVVNLVAGNSYPFAVHFDFVVVANDATLGWTTVHEVAAGALAIVSFERRVEAVMPPFVAYAVISFLCGRVCTKKHGDRRAAKKRDELPPP